MLYKLKAQIWKQLVHIPFEKVKKCEISSLLKFTDFHIVNDFVTSPSKH